MKKRIYIAGKVSGLPIAEVSMKFGAYQKKLMELGEFPIVPLDLCNNHDPWAHAMGKCVEALLICDEVHFLPCWKDSPGARIEHAIAKERLMRIIYIQ